MQLILHIALILVRVILGMLLILSLVFVVIRIIPGDPAALLTGVGSSSESVETFRERYSLNQPIARQYRQYLARIITLNFGNSYFSNQSVTALIMNRMPLTLLISLGSFLLSLVITLPLAMFVAMHQHTLLARLINVMARVVLSVPEFWVGLLLILGFAVVIPLFPIVGNERPIYLVLPIATLAISRASALFYITRQIMEKEWKKQYMVAARLRGMISYYLSARWLLPNSVPAVLPVATSQFAYLFGGAVIIEQLFGIAGFGRLLLRALQVRDYPLIEGCVTFVALVFALVTIITDLVHTYVNPTLRTQVHNRRLAE